MSLPYVMIGLLITGNQFSLPFGIGFIAFTGIAVNHGIILLDAININLRKGMQSFTALVEAGSSRLEPMLLTTLTTALWILPIALRDKFWSGLWFTIIFGLIACTFITLFVVKGFYYEVFMMEHPWLRKLRSMITAPFRLPGMLLRKIFRSRRSN
jgi:multidrug efflux pump